MFFSDDLLTTKKGSFGVIWLAATLGPRTKRITRKDLNTVDLSKTCELIAEPPEPMALRLSGCLLVGVARVYNQNYDIFYTEVTQFHTAIRRSFATEFSVAGSTGGQTAGVDLIGDGKSRLDTITFSAADPGQELGFNFDFGFDYINWNDPLGKRKRRRNTSKLDSLPSQQDGEREESSDDESEEEETDDGSELPKRRDKRSKVDSSPLIPPVKDTTFRRSTLHAHFDPLADAFDQNLDFPGDQPIDLGLMENMGDTSISGPSGRAFELPEDGMVDVNIAQDLNGANSFNDMPAESALDDLRLILEPQIHDTGNKTRRSVSAHGSAEPEGDGFAPKTKKPKRQRVVAIEDCREINEENINPTGYKTSMLGQRRSHQDREADIATDARASKLVGLGGLLLTDMDNGLEKFLYQAFRPSGTKWEAAVTASRMGKKGAPSAQQEETRTNAGPPDHHPHQGDMFGAHAIDLGGLETYDDFALGAPGLESLAPRGDSEVPEGVRRASQQSSLSNLPWQDVAFGQGDNDVPVGFDTSFSVRSFRYSIMTPQEVRIRQRSGQGSSSQAGRRARSRSASGSILGRHDAQPAMLIGGEDDFDLELPFEDYHLDITESQAEHRANLPDAFKPEMLATLETSCRDFLSYIEREMLAQSVESIQLADIAPTTTSKRVGASAFYNCLTLATKRMLSLTQEEAFGPIKIKLAT